MNSRHLGLRPLVALLALLPAAHAVPALAATPSPSPLEGTAWVLERLGPIPVPEALAQRLLELYGAITTPPAEPDDETKG